MTTTTPIPLLESLDLSAAEPRLVGQSCTACGATYLERRVACANCDGDSFRPRELPNEGTIHSYTIVHRAPDGIETPYIAATVRLDEASFVRSNIVNLAPEPDAIAAVRSVSLVTFPVATDEQGREAIAFGFAPAGEAEL